jgi:hypothetical protein
MTRALRHKNHRHTTARYADEAATAINRVRRPELTVINLNREIAELQAVLFRLDPTPQRLTQWADTYAQLPEGDAS